MKSITDIEGNYVFDLFIIKPMSREGVMTNIESQFH
jgi:hypothetical protein